MSRTINSYNAQPFRYGEMGHAITVPFLGTFYVAPHVLKKHGGWKGLTHKLLGQRHSRQSLKEVLQ